MLRGDEAQVFATHQVKLERAVRFAVHAPEAVIEDACAHAWLQFLRCQPDRSTVGAWLRTVAIRHAWHLNAREQRDAHYDAMASPQDLVEGPSLDVASEARGALHAVADLPAPQRACLTLVVAGHSYDEVASITGRSLTSVKRQLTRARRHLRLVSDATTEA